tara:strand:- start:821 stop:1201 length:381 start_codon:yes stop_codon:yes gene_type:complete
MGENLRKGQCEAFKKGTDLAMLQMSSPQLIQRPDSEWSRHDADLLDGMTAAIGETLLAQQAGDQPLVFLAKGGETIATIEEEGAIRLIEVMKHTDCPGFAEVTVVDICEISDSITVQLNDSEEDDG